MMFFLRSVSARRGLFFLLKKTNICLITKFCGHLYISGRIFFQEASTFLRKEKILGLV